MSKNKGYLLFLKRQREKSLRLEREMAAVGATISLPSNMILSQITTNPRPQDEPLRLFEGLDFPNARDRNQFPAISSLPSKYRNELLTQIYATIYDYLTKLENEGFGEFDYKSTSWEYWYRWLLHWVEFLRGNRKEISNAAISEIMKLAEKIQFTKTYAPMAWSGPWPPNFGECRKSYNEYLSARGYPYGLPSSKTCPW